MAQLARISRGVSASLRNLPSMFLIEKPASSTYQALKKTNPNPYIWMVAPRFFSNTNLTDGTSSLHSATSEDKNGGTSKCIEDKKIFKEKLKIDRVLLDYDEPYNHLIDGVKVLSTVLEDWKKRHPNFGLDYEVGDLQTPPILSRFSSNLKVDEEAIRNKISMAAEKILKLLLDYDDPMFADQVLFQAMHGWERLVSDAEADCTIVIHKNKHDKCFPSAVVAAIRGYKLLISNYDDHDSMVEEIDARIKKMLKKEEK